MKNLFKSSMIVALAMISLQSCKKDEIKPPNKPTVLEVPADLKGKFVAPTTAATEDAVMNKYIGMMYDGYKESRIEAEKLDVAIKAFIANPTEATQKAAKDAWLLARDVYGQTEVFRGSKGPIDTDVVEINNEGEINAWPLNEAFIDYVAEKNDYTGTYDKSIIADDTKTINEETLRGLNEQGGATGEDADDINAKAVSIGWHAIEFLLWGQDNTAPADKKAGQRSYTDYTTKENADRRKTYLNTVSEMLVSDLLKLEESTKVGGEFRTKFLALDKKVALSNIISGPCFLAAIELSGERMNTPANSDNGIAGAKGQEDEHSCFADNTHRDVYMNAKGIVNVVLGDYNGKGASFYDLVAAKDAKQALKLKNAVITMWVAITALDQLAKDGTPFDLMILNESNAKPGPVLKGDAALKDLGNVIKESAKVLDIIAKDDNV